LTGKERTPRKKFFPQSAKITLRPTSLREEAIVYKGQPGWEGKKALTILRRSKIYGAPQQSGPALVRKEWETEIRLEENQKM